MVADWTDMYNGNTGEEYAFSVNEEDAGERMDRWLSGRIGGISRTYLQTLVKGGMLRKNGTVCRDPALRVRPGETVCLVVPPPADPVPAPESIPLDVVYEDRDIIVVNKPAGMVVHPAPGARHGTLVNALLAHCRGSLSGIGGVARPGIVHRIDRLTSGLVVAAKHDSAHHALSGAFAARDIDRVYECIAHGAIRPGNGTIDAALVRHPSDRKKFTVAGENRNGKARHAVTRYRTLERPGAGRSSRKGDAPACYLECRLETGRTHQIRVHLAHAGHPLVGDPVYGRPPGLAGLRPGDRAADHAIAVIRNFRRQALHARTLGFAHPVHGRAIHLRQPPPADFLELLAALRAL